MEFKIITLPFDKKNQCFFAEELQKLNINKKIKAYRVEFFLADNIPYWTLFIEYERIFYPEEEINLENKLLTEDKIFLLEKLKSWRNKIAIEKGFPPYIIFTNKQLTEIADKRPESFSALQNINGVGKAKLKSYGHDIISLISDFYNNNKKYE